MQRIHNYINGKLIEPTGKTFFNNINPATGEVYSLIPDSDKHDVQQAVEAAQNAFTQWSTFGANKRYEALNKIADLIERDLEKLALAETIDNGKPLWLSRKMDIPRAKDNFRFFATAILHFASESHHMEGEALNYTLRQPLGVVGCISPWNLPMYLFTWKIAPALAAGNCVVAKPSEITPMTAFLLSEICIEAGLPAGVLNIVHGYGAKTGEAIVTHPDIKAISFTGGTKTGSHIASVAAPMFKKLSLELGGKNPNIIFADCNFEKALDAAVRASFLNQGEICLCGSRLLIEKSIYLTFRDAFVEKVKALKVGNPQDEKTFIGAIVSKEHFEKILSYIELAKQEGGKILCGGNAVHPDKNKNGYYIAPTVIEGLDMTCRTNTEEIFGPVVTLLPFENETDALQMANATEYGLATSIWTTDLNKAHRIAAKIQSGIVWINCWLLRDLRTPFGGVKDSGVGREGGWEALRFFTEAKNVCVKLEN
jgi:aminomuconate-semialdehyde/2-hydroxymuconate-6-semialdehyde dehydrogenase